MADASFVNRNRLQIEAIIGALRGRLALVPCPGSAFCT